MIGMGTIINTAAIAAGGFFGAVCGKAFRREWRETLNMACGVSTMFIGISGAMQYMLGLAESSPTGGGSMPVVLSLVLGGLIGELLNIEKIFEDFGEWLKQKSGNGGDNSFINGFVTASLTVCIGAMAIVGAVRDGISGDWSVLAAKSVLDFIIVMVMTCSMGKGCAFSAVPVFILEGGITLLAVFLKPILTAAALGYISLVGSVLIFCVGVNLVWGKKFRVANLLPAIILAGAAAFLPFSL